MKYWQVVGLVARAFFESLFVHLSFFPTLFLYILGRIIAKVFDLNILHVLLVVFILFQIPVFLFFLKDKIDNILAKERGELSIKRREFEAEKKKQDNLHIDRMAKLEREFEVKKKELDKLHIDRMAILERESRAEKKKQDKIYANKLIELERERIELESERIELENILITTHPFTDSASLMADVHSIVFDKIKNYITYKPHPACKSSKDAVKDSKRLAKDAERRYREILYKYEYILSIFPIIAEYAENEEDLLSIAEASSIEEIEENRDRSRDYLSNEEWNRLSTSERNQLALDRYISRQKSKWQIGRDYEMCCAHYLEQRNFGVCRNGIEKGFEDMGIDLIATRQSAPGCFETYVIQCKCWKSDRPIRENVIFQLYGSYILYELQYRQSKNSLFLNSITPVIMAPDFSQLSDTAKLICNRLRIKIVQLPFTEFPRIKCNINNGSKIYHLPFDQQYDRTEIKLQGEFYARTVAEAENAGFRRAKRHFAESKC